MSSTPGSQSSCMPRSLAGRMLPCFLVLKEHTVSGVWIVSVRGLFQCHVGCALFQLGFRITGPFCIFLGRGRQNGLNCLEQVTARAASVGSLMKEQDLQLSRGCLSLCRDDVGMCGCSKPAFLGTFCSHIDPQLGCGFKVTDTIPGRV